MFKRKRKSHVSIELKDYVLRAIVAKGPELVSGRAMSIL